MSTMSTTSVAPEVRKRVLGSRDRFWRPEDFDGSPDAVAQALSRTGPLRGSAPGPPWPLLAGRFYPAGHGSPSPGSPRRRRRGRHRLRLRPDGAPPWRSACRPRWPAGRRSLFRADHLAAPARSTTSAVPPHQASRRAAAPGRGRAVGSAAGLGRPRRGSPRRCRGADRATRQTTARSASTGSLGRRRPNRPGSASGCAASSSRSDGRT